MRAARAEKRATEAFVCIGWVSAAHVERSCEVQRGAGGKGAQQSGFRRAMGCTLKMDAEKRSLWEVTVAVVVRKGSLPS